MATTTKLVAKSTWTSADGFSTDTDKDLVYVAGTPALGQPVVLGTGGLATGIPTATNVGTASAGSTAAEYGDAYWHRTVLTVSTTLPAIAGGAALGVGKQLYAFPAGALLINRSYMSIEITQTEGNITADTPEVGLGTVIATGAVAVLSTPATFENIITGTAAADCNGTATVVTAIPTAGIPLVIEAADAHTLFLNVADTWAASGDTAALLAGTVVVDWSFMA